MKRRIGIIEPVGGHVGFDTFDLKLAEHIHRRGWGTDLYTSGVHADPPPGVVVRNWFDGAFDKSRPLRRRVVFLTGILRSLLDATIKGAQVINVHLFEYRLPDVLTVTLAKLLGRKVVLVAHDFESFDTPGNDKYRDDCLSRADIIVVLNPSTRALMVEYYPEFEAKIRLVPFGDYLHLRSDLERAKSSQPLAAPEGRRNILFFGQIKEAKGLDVLIRAAPTVAKSAPRVAFVIAGRVWRTDFAGYAAMIEEAGAQDVFFLDIRFIPDEDLLVYFRNCELVVLPYRRIYQSAVLLLAMSLGKVAIVSDLPALVGTVQDGVNGFVFRAGDPADLARVCLRALNTPTDELAAMSQRAIETVRRDHNWSLIGERFTAACEDALA